jgi:glyoxylate reductase
MKKVLITRGFIETEIGDSLKDFDVIVGDSSSHMDRQEILSILPECHGVIIRHVDLPNREFIDCGKNLEIIANYGAGYETVDVEYATSRGVWVTNTPDVLNGATADVAMLLILNACRLTYRAETYLRNGLWVKSDPNKFHGIHLGGKTLGIVGYGRIAQALSKRAQSFDMSVVYNKRNKLSEDEESRYGVSYRSLDNLLAESDVVCALTPLTSETKGLFNNEAFDKMKRGAVFVNISRGKVVDETALVAALKSGHLAAAGLDVFENEPMVNADLLKLDNVTLLPHIGSAATEIRKQMADLAVANLSAVLRGEAPLTPVNKIG